MQRILDAVPFRGAANELEHDRRPGWRIGRPTHPERPAMRCMPSAVDARGEDHAAARHAIQRLVREVPRDAVEDVEEVEKVRYRVLRRCGWDASPHSVRKLIAVASVGPNDDHSADR